MIVKMMNLMSNCQNVAQQFVAIHADSCTDIWFSLSCVSLALVSDNIIHKRILDPVLVTVYFLPSEHIAISLRSLDLVYFIGGVE